MTGYKILFTGPMGAGKTTAIRALSEIAPISTDVDNNDRSESGKDTTTVAFDYGEIRLDDGTLLRLYGTPGQSRFDFMWRVLSEGALGVVVLLDNRRPDIGADALAFLGSFPTLTREGACVIGVGCFDPGAGLGVEALSRHLDAHGYCVPVIEIDARKREDAMLMLQILVAQIEARSLS